MISSFCSQYAARYMGIIASRVECPPYEGPEASPIMFVKAEGARLFDENGDQYIDFCNGKGSIVVGHNDVVINTVIADEILSCKNIVTGPSPIIVDLSELLLETVPLKERGRVAFFPTGTESLRACATMLKDSSKQGLASIILTSGWHGWDPMWRSSGRLLEPNTDGVVDVFFVPELLETAIKKYRDLIAGFILSPDYSHLSAQTLKRLLLICRQNGIRVICDDVKQGLRYSASSSLEMIGEVADAYVFSKGLSNGRRLACVIGDLSILKPASSYTYTNYFESSSLVAAFATLSRMKEIDGYLKIRHSCETFVNAALKIFKGRNYPVKIISSGALFQFIFPSDNLANKFYKSAFKAGLVFYASDNQAPSAAFNTEIISESLTRLNAVVDEIEPDRAENEVAISEERYFWTAWRQMDGATDSVQAERAIGLIEKALKEGKL